MRRFVIVVVAVLAVCAIFATPVKAQVRHDGWFLNAGVGPSFGTLGSTPIVDASTGFKLTDRISLVGEFGMLPHTSVEKAADVAPTVPPVIASREKIYANNYHANGNLVVEPAAWSRFSPYVTGGFGSFTGSTVAIGKVGDTRISAYRDATHPATNLGAGVTYRLSDWLGVNADYRHFIVHADGTRNLNRFMSGVTFFVR